MLRTRWKPHKSKDHIFLHRSCTPIFFSTPKKNIVFSRSKKKISEKVKIFEICEISKFGEKIYNRVSFVIFEISKISIFFGFFPIFFGHFFFDLFHFFFWKKKIDREKIYFFGVEKKIGVQLRCKKIWSFDLWGFQRVLSTLTPPTCVF